MRSHKAVSDSAPSRCLHRPQANAATRAGAMREDACSTRVETRKASGKWSAWRPMMTWQYRRASTDRLRWRAHVRHREGRTHGHAKSAGRELTREQCHHAARAPHRRVYVWRSNPPMRRDVPLARPHPSSRPRRQPTQRAAPEPTADASPKSRQPESSGRRKPTAVKDKIPPTQGGRARVRTCHSERSRGI